MTQNLAKWISTIKISWVKYTAYKINFFLTIIGPSLVFFFVKYNLWASIYKSNTGIAIQGYDFNQMIQYHLWAFIIALVASGFASWNLSDDIRLGRISSYLVYPFNFWEFHTASWIGFQCLQIFIASITLGLALAFNIIPMPSLQVILTGLSFTTFVSLFWFTLQYFSGLLSFWLEETWILRVILSIIATFLSGAIIPLELFPSWLVSILNYTPFPYLSYYPIKIFQGGEVDLIRGYTMIGSWTLGVTLLNKLTWRKGMKLYTAAGM
jgi:ABC-2 type transport system permease protein